MSFSQQLVEDMKQAMKAGDKVKLIVMKSEGVVTETSFHRVKVRFENMNSEFNESTWWFDWNMVRKAEK